MLRACLVQWKFGDFYSLPSSPITDSMLEEPYLTRTKFSPQKHSNDNHSLLPSTLALFPFIQRPSDDPVVEIRVDPTFGSLLSAVMNVQEEKEILVAASNSHLRIYIDSVRRLLCSARPVAIQTSANPSASDQDLQQAQLWQLAQRTTALPLGRGAFTLATIYTLLTEAFTVPKLVLAGRLPAQQNATVGPAIILLLFLFSF
ncbi:anaphase-promoting complex subunit 1 [Gossypium hirsutum]|uniref:Anaphase-promoting complex subunit 1 n=1 Tax=Gossypium hirsutum TaxID=3635 RepID=A0ABM2YYP2_GOSHI|nr:anaphase-promoting complex subunit 1 [Gossypium hirsutum]